MNRKNRAKAASRTRPARTRSSRPPAAPDRAAAADSPDGNASAPSGASSYARSLIEASLDPLVTISPEGKITDVNAATVLVTGVPRERLIGSDFSGYFTEPERARAGYRKVIAEGEVRDYPLTIRHAEGRTTDVLYNATVYRNEAGAVQGVFAAARDVTERNRMEEELRRASRYARSLLEASLDPLVTISPEGTITDVNEATVLVTGVPRERLIGSDFSAYFTEPDRARAGYRQVIAQGEVRDYALTIRHLHGRTTDVLYNATVYRNETGEVQGVFAAARDVTERKRAERALRESELRYRMLFESIDEGFCVIEMLYDAEGRPHDYRFVEINPAFEAQTGLHDARGRTIREMVPGHDEHWFRIYGEVAGTGQPIRFENRAEAMGRWFDVYALRLGGPGSGRVALLFTNITERKRMEEELRTASLYARSLLEASLDPLVTISDEGKITDVNRATEQVTGIGREALVGSDFSLYFTEPERADAGYREVLARGQVIDYPLTIRHTSGRTTDVLYNATVYRDPAGKVQGVFAAARDITERREAERELARYRDHLEELVQQRTGELEAANAQLLREVEHRQRVEESLRRTADELARSNQDLEQFAYVASHDLQEPLRAVTGYLGLIDERLRERLDEKGRYHLAGAVQGAARMHTLINDLLSLSRVDTRARAFAEASLDRVLDDVLESLSVRIRESGATVTRDPLPIVSVDAGQIAQLLQNLIGNALKFRRDEPPRIHVGAEERPEGWVVRVRDNGIGIERQYFPRIFLIFQRLHTRAHYPGTGIGLAICKRIVERHGGAIWVESEPGFGSTFTFTLPHRGVS